MSRFDRRSFVAMLGTSLGQLALPSDLRPEQKPPAKHNVDPSGRRPNIIIMICDDLGSGDLGCYGSTLNTPNLDRMAAQGMRFTHFNTAHPICSASRGALLTGRYSTRTGTRPVYFPTSTDGMGLDETTLANLLHTQKYRSMCVGKWHLGHMPEYLPTNRGFDSYLGVPYSVDMQPLPMIKDLTEIEKNADRALLTPRYTEAAVQFIESSSPEPFFLYLAYSYPHIPINASPRFKGKSQQGIYADAVEEIDWSVAEVLRSLQRKNLDENTLVLFTGDHGPWFQGSPGAHRGRKGTTYEGGCRVPFLARWSGVIPAGTTCDEAASSLDVVPTIAAICGAGAPPKPLDGVDISSLLTGNQKLDRPEPLLYFSGLRGGFDLQCARLGKWKLRIAQYARETYVLGSDPGENLLLSKFELYDLDKDPGESYDVAEDFPLVVKHMAQAIERLVPTFPEKVVETYYRLKKNPDSPATPAGASPRPASYVAGPHHLD
jgi:arylsulfatase A